MVRNRRGDDIGRLLMLEFDDSDAASSCSTFDIRCVRSVGYCFELLPEKEYLHRKNSQRRQAYPSRWCRRLREGRKKGFRMEMIIKIAETLNVSRGSLAGFRI